MRVKVLRCWSSEIGRPKSIRCEVIEVAARRRTDDRKFLRDLVHERLNLQLAYSLEETFTDCGRLAATAFLRHGLTRTQAYDSPLMSEAWASQVVEVVHGFMSESARWFSTEQTHEACAVEALASAKSRWGTPLTLDRTFESLVAGVAAGRAFLFYAWDED